MGLDMDVSSKNLGENNGRILRYLNAQHADMSNLASVCEAMAAVSVNAFKASLLYLIDSGYISLEHPDGRACLDGGPLDIPVRIIVTGAGIALLAGVTSDPAVAI